LNNVQKLLRQINRASSDCKARMAIYKSAQNAAEHINGLELSESEIIALRDAACALAAAAQAECDYLNSLLPQ